MHEPIPSNREDTTKRCGTCGRVKHRASSRRYYERNREHHIAVIRARTKAQKTASVAFVARYPTTHPCIDCRNCRAIVTYERMGSNWRSLAMSDPERLVDITSPRP